MQWKQMWYINNKDICWIYMEYNETCGIYVISAHPRERQPSSVALLQVSSFTTMFKIQRDQIKSSTSNSYFRDIYLSDWTIILKVMNGF